MRTLTASILVAVIATPYAMSQSPQKQNDSVPGNVLSFTVGAEAIPAITLGTSPTAPPQTLSESTSYSLDLAYGRKLHTFSNVQLWLDVPALVGPSHRSTSASPSLPTSLATFYVTPSARVAFPFKHEKWSPWISGGGGYGLHETSDFLVNGASNPTIHTHTGVLQIGAGLDVVLPIRVLVPLGFRTEFRDFYSLSAPTLPVPVASSGQHGLTAGAGLVARF